MILNLIRHGPKNNDPSAHGTGVEALLDPAQIYKILRYAADSLEQMHRQGIQQAVVETTPVPRAYMTGKLITAALSLDPKFASVKCSLDNLIGSYEYDINLTNGRVINLSSAAMSEVWAEAKKSEKYGALQGEHKPLYAWCEQGFDNPQANNPQDPGISLREIACRIGTYVHKKIKIHERIKSGEEKVSTTAVGHSGDIEPFLYLCLEMKEGRDGSDKKAMVRRFDETCGALSPMAGLSLETAADDAKKVVISSTPIGTGGHAGRWGIFEADIFAHMADWYKQHGRSRQVLEQKLHVEK